MTPHESPPQEGSNASRPSPASHTSDAHKGHLKSSESAPSWGHGSSMGQSKLFQGLLLGLGLCGVAGVVLSFFLWDKLSHVQELVARQSADTSQVSMESKGMAKEALEMGRDTAAKLALTQNKLNEVVLQRSQMDALMQSLSRSRDETLVEDIEASLRLAQQQALLTGSLQPLLAALKTAEDRLAKVSQPRLSGLQRAIAKDTDRVKSFSLADTPNLLIQFDEMMRLLDELALANDVFKPKDKDKAQSNPLALAPAQSVAPNVGASSSFGSTSQGASKTTSHDGQGPWAQSISQGWWQKALELVWQEFKGLVRVSQIDQPQGVLISPEQAYFVRENLKLRLLNARMALLARQIESAKADTAVVQNEIQKYFDLHQKNTTVALSLLQNIQLNLKQLQLPPLTESFSAIAQTQSQVGR